MSKTYIPTEMRRRVEQRAGCRCGYCRTPQWITGVRLQVDHIHPEADGGKTVDANLWMACVECNVRKNARVVVLDPLT